MLDYDSPLGRIFSTVANLLLLNFIFILTALPLITVGASLTALYTATINLVRQDGESPVKVYFRAWKKNFGRSTLLWLASLMVLAVMVLDALFFRRIGFPGASLLFYFSVVCIIAFLVVLTYLFPVQSTFYTTFWAAFKNAALFLLAFPVDALILSAITFVPVVLLLTHFAQLLIGFLTLYVFIGFSLQAYINAFIFDKIFKQYTGAVGGKFAVKR